MSVKSKHSSKKDSIALKEKKKKIEDSEEDFETSEEELDLTKECHPIGYYMNDRAEMINQMFSVIKGNKLKAMLPPTLKDCDTEQLKLQCLDQLLGMSERRITYILEGEVLETSSESEVLESDQCESEERNGTTSVSSSDRSNDSREEDMDNTVDVKFKKRKKNYSNQSKPGKLPKMESEPVEQGKTLLEILELEMRARAIRALLKQSGNEKGGEQASEDTRLEVNGMKELSGEIVDLTECEDEEMPLQNARKELRDEERLDNKVSTFEEKIEKSQTEKLTPPVDNKSKRFQAELELRNKLFKKKIYRTRQQRMENDEEEKNWEKLSEYGNNASSVTEVIVKREPLEPEEIVLEEPEEGELSTSEDECLAEIKQEPPERAEELPQKPMEEPVAELIENDFETKMDDDAERVMAIDNGTFVKSNNLEAVAKSDQKREGEEKVQLEGREKISVVKKGGEGEKDEVGVEETSWRDRWLRKDGVQKLVKSSKIYAKVKKRIAQKSQKAREDPPTSFETNSDSNSNSKLEMIEGSIEEYERLLGRSVGTKDEDIFKNGNSNQSASVVSENSNADKINRCELSKALPVGD